MPSTHPQSIVAKIEMLRAGLVVGLLSKEWVINWADDVIRQEDEPDDFFIDLSLMAGASEEGIIRYFSNYLHFSKPTIKGDDLFGALYQQYHNGQLSLSRTIAILYRIRQVADLVPDEENAIESLEYGLALAQSNISGTIGAIQIKLEAFLSGYKNSIF